MISSTQLKEMYFKFFQSMGHKLIPSASLIPENDPSVLFTTAGMHPLVPYLLGEAHPAGKRLCNVQKCIRTGDIDEVGDSWHLSFFEMLGNFSFGDYFKKEQIEWVFEYQEKRTTNDTEFSKEIWNTGKCHHCLWGLGTTPTNEIQRTDQRKRNA